MSDRKLTISIRAHPDVKKALKRQAKLKKMNVCALGRKIIIEFLQQQGETIEFETLRSHYKSAISDKTRIKRLNEPALSE